MYMYFIHGNFSLVYFRPFPTCQRENLRLEKIKCLMYYLKRVFISNDVWGEFKKGQNYLQMQNARSEIIPVYSI